MSSNNANSLENNLWSTLLKESSKRPKQLQATCVLAGDIGSGKNSLLNKVCNNKSLSNNNGNEIISYNYLDLSDEGLSEDIENVSRINIWTISDKSFDQSFDVLVNPKITDSVSTYLLFLYLFIHFFLINKYHFNSLHL
jgi:septin family protein